jgi:hypothetical protein
VKERQVHNEVWILRKAHCKFCHNNSKQRNSYLPNLQSKMATISQGRRRMKIKDVAEYHLEQAKEANSCNEREQEQYHLEMLSALLEETDEN